MKAIMLMDLANVYHGLQNKGLTLDPIGTYRSFRDVANGGKIVGMWSFGDYSFPVYPKMFQRNLMSAGFQLVHCPRLDNLSAEGKSTDDDELLAQAHWLLNEGVDFDTVYLVSGDRNFLRVAQRYLNAGKKVVLVDPELLNASHDLLDAIGQEVNLLAANTVPKTKSVPDSTPVVPVPEATATTPIQVDAPFEIVIPGNPNPSDLEKMFFLIRGEDSDSIAQVLLAAESDPDYRWAYVLDRFYGTLDIFLAQQERLGLPSAFGHVLNVMENPESYTRGPLTGSAIRVETSADDPASAYRYEAPSWVAELGHIGIKDLLDKMKRSGLIRSDVIEAYNGRQSVNSLSLSRAHPFAIAYEDKEQRLLALEPETVSVS